MSMNETIKKAKKLVDDVKKAHKKAFKENDQLEANKPKRIDTSGSTALSDAEYNPNRNSMEVEYKNSDTTYEYFGVSENEAEGLKKASSKGNYNYYNIRPKFYRKK